MNYKCIFCQTRAFEKKVSEFRISEDLKYALTKDYFKYMANADECLSAPEAASDIYRLMRNKTKILDPFKDEKAAINNYLLELYSEFKIDVESSKNPFDKALRLSIAGNIIDNVASPDYNLHKAFTHVLSSDFAIDHSAQLYDEIQKADTILYLGDNAGEIVMDKLFIETIHHPNVYFAVRGLPVINDVTIEDANLVGMQNVANLISNGTDAPSTILSKSSDEFLAIYEKADVIISKGQGNFEGLMNEKSKNIFFLFMVKCEVIAEIVGAEKGDFVVTNNKYEKVFSLI